MFGAVIGDVIGSAYEWDNVKTKDFPLFDMESEYTDDTVMTIAVAKSLLRSIEEDADFSRILVEEMQRFGKLYPNAGYGGKFSKWLVSSEPVPYYSFGNGSAMRVSPCGLIAVELSEALSLAKASAEVTHNHPDGIKGAQAIAGAVYLAKNKKSKKEIRDFVELNFYDLDFTLDEIRAEYDYDLACQASVPQAVVAFLESEDFEDAIRNAISIGGDSDTIAAMTGAIALSYYGEMDWEKNEIVIPSDQSDIISNVLKFLPDDFVRIMKDFNEVCIRRAERSACGDFCSPIKHKADNSHKSAFVLIPETMCAEGKPLRERFSNISKDEVLHRFCSGERFARILWDMKIGVTNYNDHFEIINGIMKNIGYLREATLEECLLYLTFLWRSDYHEGGYPDFDYRHREELRLARMRLIELLS